MADDLIPIPDGLTQLPISRQPGIYFLFYHGLVVYVGQSVDMGERVRQHLADGTKVIDAASFMPCSIGDLNRLERRYIEQMAPKYNQCCLAKFMRRTFGDRLDTRIQPYGTLSAEMAAAFLGMTIEDFRELRRQGKGPRRTRKPGRRGAGYHTRNLREFAQANGITIS